METATESRCPNCGSKDYLEVDDSRKYYYPILKCNNCNEEFWSE